MYLAGGPGSDSFVRGMLYPQESQTDEMMGVTNSLVTFRMIFSGGEKGRGVYRHKGGSYTSDLRKRGLCEPNPGRNRVTLQAQTGNFSIQQGPLPEKLRAHCPNPLTPHDAENSVTLSYSHFVLGNQELADTFRVSQGCRVSL